jgi:hypothetical protein
MSQHDSKATVEAAERAEQTNLFTPEDYRP